MAELSALVLKYKKNLEEVPQRAFVRMADLVILGTPVDTGSARASWTPSSGGPSARNVYTTGGAGYPQRGTVQAVARALRPGGSASLANALPYIRRLEYAGWSAQAPSGMLRVAAAQWQSVVNEAAASVR